MGRWLSDLQEDILKALLLEGKGLTITSLARKLYPDEQFEETERTRQMKDLKSKLNLPKPFEEKIEERIQESKRPRISVSNKLGFSLDSLERRGYIEEERTKDMFRRKVFVLTDKGREATLRILQKEHLEHTK